ncbi:MAG: DEAD/DEAH box helicase, partial [Planctomycetes bacterium]|nr:DEAD/DEAH box helicase [Planctomycetota bacterium]
MTQFTDLDLSEPIQRALAQEGYTTPTEIQARSIPALLDGRDVMGCAQTGTGKTAAFLLPVLQYLSEERPPRGKRPIRALILTPTRELAAQIGASATAYGRFLSLKHTVIFGGTGEGNQIRALRSGLDLLVATPGRLLDLMGRGFIDLRSVEFFVLDEADRMLDMGFIHDVRRVVERLPEDRQNLLFSATLDPKVTKLAASFLYKPLSVNVTPVVTSVEKIDQTVMFVEKANKRFLLIKLLKGEGVESVIVFTRTKHGANRLTKQLNAAGIEAGAIHGNKSQGARTRTLNSFRAGDLTVLVATDLASRGLDVEHVTHVFNYELPNEPASYVHRIGRTGRAGRSGIAISFCDADERDYLRDIYREIGQSIPVDDTHEYHSNAAPIPPPVRGRGQAGGRGRDGGQSRGGRGGGRGR